MERASIDDPGADSDPDFPIVIATMATSARQHKVSIGAFVVLVAIVAATIPFANMQLARVDAFVPVIQTVMCVADLLTAVLLFAQYSVCPQRAALALASGYVFSGLFAFLQRTERRRDMDRERPAAPWRFQRTRQRGRRLRRFPAAALGYRCKMKGAFS
jgi:hypothetical protein